MVRLVRMIKEGRITFLKRGDILSFFISARWW